MIAFNLKLGLVENCLRLSDFCFTVCKSQQFTRALNKWAIILQARTNSINTGCREHNWGYLPSISIWALEDEKWQPLWLQYWIEIIQHLSTKFRDKYTRSRERTRLWKDYDQDYERCPISDYTARWSAGTEKHWNICSVIIISNI